MGHSQKREQKKWVGHSFETDYSIEMESQHHSIVKEGDIKAQELNIDITDSGDNDTKYRKQEMVTDPFYNEISNINYLSTKQNPAILDTNHIFSIYIIKRNNQYLCRHEATNSFRSQLLTDSLDNYRVKRYLFLTKVAEWLEKKQQNFLRDPQIQNLKNKPTQKVFCKEIKDHAGKQIYSSTSFSSHGIKNSIWLIWKDKVMPFDLIFSGK